MEFIQYCWPLAKTMLFQLDAENAHGLAMHFLKCIKHPKKPYEVKKQELMGLTFLNQVGLAAGFDKNAECLAAWQSLGFGFVEVGTVTLKPQVGNPRPRLWRLTKDFALLNRMGFNNIGAEQVIKNIEIARVNGVTIPIGVNIGKNKQVAQEDASRDYRNVFEKVADISDYVVINVSSPNTPGLRDLQQQDFLQKILDEVCAANDKRYTPRPILLKIAPDLNDGDVVSCVDVALKAGLCGIIATNTTTQKQGLLSKLPSTEGGVSGQPLMQRATDVLRLVGRKAGSKLILIGSGGVMNAQDAIKKKQAGADLVQLYTGFVYGGPGVVKKIADAYSNQI